VSGHHDFLNPRCRPATLRAYSPRRAILGAIRSGLPSLHGRLLDVGSGYAPYKPLVMARGSRVEEYVGLDLAGNQYQKPDIEWDGRTMPIESGSFDCAMATEVLEHCPDPQVVLKEICRVLRPGGALLFTVPFLWPLHTVPYDEYRYTPFSLRRHLTEAGFSIRDLKALGGYHAALAQMIALWVWRPGAAKWERSITTRLATPIVYSLTQRDRPPTEFGENVMITGLYGIATKGEA